jgi:hypothetical protein
MPQETPEFPGNKEMEDATDFTFPKPSKGSQIQNYILFGVSVIFIPVLFLILMFQIQKLKKEEGSKKDSLLFIIAKEGFKLNAKIDMVNSSSGPKIEIPPIRVIIQSPNEKPPKKSFAKANYLIDQIEKLECPFCVDFDFDTAIKKVDESRVKNELDSILIEISKFDELYRTNFNEQKAFFEERIRHNIRVSRADADKIKQYQEEFMKFSNEAIGKVTIAIDKTHLKSIPKGSDSMFNKKFIMDSLFFLNVNKLVLNSLKKLRQKKLDLTDTIAKVNQVRILLTDLKLRCQQFRKSAERSAKIIGQMKIGISDSVEVNSEDLNMLNELLENFEAQVADLNSKIRNAKEQINELLKNELVLDIEI